MLSHQLLSNPFKGSKSYCSHQAKFSKTIHREKLVKLVGAVGLLATLFLASGCDGCRQLLPGNPQSSDICSGNYSGTKPAPKPIPNGTANPTGGCKDQCTATGTQTDQQRCSNCCANTNAPGQATTDCQNAC